MLYIERGICGVYIYMYIFTYIHIYPSRINRGDNYLGLAAPIQGSSPYRKIAALPAVGIASV